MSKRKRKTQSDYEREARDKMAKINEKYMICAECGFIQVLCKCKPEDK